MPCYDSQAAQAGEERRKAVAALCAILTALERRGDFEAALFSANWLEAGVSEKWLRDWWQRHKAEDAARLDRERKARL